MLYLVYLPKYPMFLILHSVKILTTSILTQLQPSGQVAANSPTITVKPLKFVHQNKLILYEIFRKG